MSPTHVESEADPEADGHANSSGAHARLPVPSAGVGASILTFSPILLLALPYHGLATYDPDVVFSQGLRPAEDFFFSPAATTPWLILALTAWLAWRRRDALACDSITRFDAMLVGLGWTIAAALLGWSVHTQSPHLLAPSLGSALLALAISLGGRNAGRRFALPAAFLLFAVPVPAPLANEIAYGLQRASTAWATTLLDVFGLGYQISGDLIRHGDRVFQVIEGCSGFRSILLLPMATIIYLELSYRSRGQAVLLLCASPLIAFALNGFRILSMILNPDSDLSEVHTTQGLLTIVVGIALVALFDVLLERAGVLRPSDSSHSERGRAAPRSARVALTAGLALSLAVIPSFVPVWKEQSKGGFTLVAFPARPTGWKSSSEAFDRTFHGSLHFDERVSTLFRNAEESATALDVTALVAVDHRLDPGRSGLSSRAILPGTGARILEENRGRRSSKGESFDEIRVLRNGREELVWAWYEEANGMWMETLRAACALDRSLARRPASLLFVRISTPIGRDGAGLHSAVGRLTLFAEAYRERLATANRARFAP